MVTRAHYFITRGAAIESVASLTKVLIEVEFYAFAEKALALPKVKGLLRKAVNDHNQAEHKESVKDRTLSFKITALYCRLSVEDIKMTEATPSLRKI